MSFIKNRFHALNYTIFVIFVEVYILFVIFGARVFYLLFNVGGFNLTFFIVEIVIVISNIWIYILLTKFHLINQDSNNNYEVGFGILFITMLLFSTIITDLSVSNIILLPIDYLIYLVIMMSIMLFLAGIVSNIMLENIRKQRGFYISEINNSEENLSLLLNTMENQRIDYVHQLLINNDYDTAIEYIDFYLNNQTKNLKNLVEIKELKNDLITKFFETKLELLKELNLSVDIRCSLEDINLKENKYLLEILGIIIDNAIEASFKSNPKFILLKIYKIENNTIIEVTNSALQEDISNLNKKVSNKGIPQRKNGLKLLDILLEDSSITVIKEINNTITYKLFI
jgi:two-component system sensor histidine kinase AgrC